MLAKFFQVKEHHPRFTVLNLVLIALFICYIDRVMFSVAAIEMQSVFQWSDSEKGLAMSAFFIGYLIMQLLGGIISNKVGSGIVLMVSVLFWSLFTLLTPVAATLSFTGLLIARFLLGVGEGAAFPAAYQIINQWMKVNERSRSYGLMNTATATGSVFALLITGSLISLLGWQWVFYIFGGLGFIWTFYWYKKVPKLTDYQKDDSLAKAVKDKIPYKALFCHQGVWVLYLIGMLMGAMIFALSSWLPSYFVDAHGLSMEQAGLYSVLPWLVLSFVSPMTGLCADKLLQKGYASLTIRKLITTIGLMLIALSSFTISTIPALPITLIAVVTLFVGFGVCVTGYVPLAGELYPKHGDVIYGFVAALGSFSSVFVIAATGFMLDIYDSYAPLFVGITIGAVFISVIFLVFAKNKPAPESMLL